MIARGELLRLSSICGEIAADCEADTVRREGQIFNGHNVAVALGETNAMIAVLAEVVGKVIVGIAEEVPS